MQPGTNNTSQKFGSRVRRWSIGKTHIRRIHSWQQFRWRHACKPSWGRIFIWRWLERRSQQWCKYPQCLPLMYIYPNSTYSFYQCQVGQIIPKTPIWLVQSREVSMKPRLDLIHYFLITIDPYLLPFHAALATSKNIKKAGVYHESQSSPCYTTRCQANIR